MRNQPAAQSVSRVLADAGERPLPSGTSRMREGIRVTKNSGTGVAVIVDHDSERESAERADRLATILTDAGFTLERPYPNHLRVTGKAEAKAQHPERIEFTFIPGSTEPKDYRLVALGRAGSALYRLAAPGSGQFVLRTAEGETSLSSKIVRYNRNRANDYTYEAPPEGGRWSWIRPEARSRDWGTNVWRAEGNA